MARSSKTLFCCAVLFFCTACYSKTHWKTDQICGGRGAASSSRLLYSISSSQEVGLEVFQINDSKKAFLFLSFPLQGEHSFPVSFSTDEGDTLIYPVQRCAGGEHFVLPQESIDSILQLLLEKKTITVEILGKKSTISSEGFLPCYRQFLKKPSSP